VHPRARRELETSTDYNRLLAMVRDYLQDVGSHLDIPVYDFSEESNFHGSDDGWYDCYHVDASNAALITERLTGGLRASGF
jgi:predicted nucleic acid-binding Zn finger protein